MASPVIGEGLNLLCSMIQPPQAERSPSNPDLLVRLAAGLATQYDSSHEPNALQHAFAYAFVVPTAAIPSEGIRFDVLDADAGQHAELIGSSRITREVLEKAFYSETKVLSLREGAVTRLDLVVGPYTPLAVPTTKANANSKPVPVQSRPLIAGEVVTLRAQGRYTIGSWYDSHIDPAGYPGGEAQRYNFKQEPFRSAPHACAIALVGDGSAIDGAVIGTNNTFAVRHGGPLRVGLNDTDPRNNEGWFSFEGATRAPTPQEWLSGRIGD